MRKGNRLFILHEYGDPRHFRALYHLEASGHLDIASAEFDIPKQVARILLRRGRASTARLTHNARHLVKLWHATGQTIVVGAAPFDPMISLLRRLKARNRVIYFTSWPYWGQNVATPKRPLCMGQQRQWHEFLRDVSAVGVTRAARDGVARFGARAVHIPHCVDVSRFVPPVGRDKGSKTIILFVGHLIQRKGIDRLLEIASARPWDNVEFWFVGKGPYGPKISRLSRERPIRHLGFVSDQASLAELYRQSDILVLPAREEKFGLVLLEAMASGLPVVTTDCVGPAEIVENGVEGYVVSRNSTAAFLEALEELVCEPATRSRLGSNARRKAERTYSTEAVAETWLQLLENAPLPT